MSDDIAPSVMIDRIFIGGPLAGHRERVSFGTKVWYADDSQLPLIDEPHMSRKPVQYVAEFAVMENGYLHYFRLADEKPHNVVQELVGGYMAGCEARAAQASAR